MKLLKLQNRDGWQARMEALGFAYHSFDGHYWMDHLGLELSTAEAAETRAACEQAHQMGLEIVAEAVRTGDYEPWKLPREACSLIERSWRAKEPSVYGRFDLTFGPDGRAKIYEYNADTPTSIMEAGPAQSDWASERGLESACSIGEHMPEAFANLRAAGCRRIAIAGLSDSTEDTANLMPMVGWASQAGLDASFQPIEGMEYDGLSRKHGFDGQDFDWIFKLYPWEYLLIGENGEAPPSLRMIADSSTRFIEPAWKILLSSKAFLAEAWRLNKGHPNLLPAYHSGAPGEGLEGGFAKKPLYSREGANIAIAKWSGSGLVELQSEVGPYGREGHILQAYCPMPEPEPGMRFTIGGWICGDARFAGNCARFTDDHIVTNVSWTCGCCLAQDAGGSQ